ncbi:helix-turn-helix transcriptional regulator [Vibrio cholerae]
MQLIRYNYFESRKQHTLKDVLIYVPTVLWVKKGKKLVFWRGQRLEFTKDSWFVSSGNQNFSFSNNLDKGTFASESLSFYSQPSLEYIEISKKNGIRNQFPPIIPVNETMRFLFKSLSEISNLDESVQSGILDVFYLYLASQGFLHYLFSPKDSVAERVIRILSVDPARNYCIADIANYLGFSRATLARKLEREHTSFRRIQIDIRMTYSLCLLQKSDVQDVAHCVGYSSLHRFCQRFKKQFGLTPYEYVEINNNNNCHF